MNKFITTAIALCMLSGSVATASAAGFDRNDNRGNRDNRSGYSQVDNRGQQNNRFDNQRFNKQSKWKKGGRIERNDWNRGKRVDYRTYHLQKPARGYEWRQVDGNLVLATAVTGLIASILLANR